MRNRLPYSPTLIARATYIARITFQQRGLTILTKRGRQHVVRLDSRREGLPITSGSRSWP